MQGAAHVSWPLPCDRLWREEILHHPSEMRRCQLPKVQGAIEIILWIDESCTTQESWETIVCWYFRSLPPSVRPAQMLLESIDPSGKSLVSPSFYLNPTPRGQQLRKTPNLKLAEIGLIRNVSRFGCFWGSLERKLIIYVCVCLCLLRASFCGGFEEKKGSQSPLMVP